MSVDTQLQDPRVVEDRLGHGVQHREGLPDDRVLTSDEEHLVQDDDLLALDDRLHLVRAAVVVLDAVEVLRLVRAEVVLVEDGVLVGVGVLLLGAAVLVRRAVHVLGLVRAGVVHVEHAVAVVVRIRAAILVLELVEVFAVERALVIFVEDAVAVVVEVRAAVLVVVVVLVLGIVRATVLVVGDAVLVAVRDGQRSPADAGEDPELGRAAAKRQARPATSDDIEAHVRAEPQVRQDLQGHVKLVLGTTVGHIGPAGADHRGAHQLDVDVEHREGGEADGRAERDLVARRERVVDDRVSRLDHVSAVQSPVERGVATADGHARSKGGHAVAEEQLRAAGRQRDDRLDGDADGLLGRVQQRDLRRDREIAQRVVPTGTEPGQLAYDRHLHEGEVEVDLEPIGDAEAHLEVSTDDSVDDPVQAFAVAADLLKNAVAVVEGQPESGLQPRQRARRVHRDELVEARYRVELLRVERGLDLGVRGTWREAERERETTDDGQESSKCHQGKFPLIFRSRTGWPPTSQVLVRAAPRARARHHTPERHRGARLTSVLRGSGREHGLKSGV